ncbi:MAG: CoA pyrophosphatase [Caldilineales bacterium]|nr:CoA pyrophosphatase [Caldilineales bacterium]MDW8318981.1 CoA pyrophosphatase [Anaerolineae bacterium]
MTTPLTPDALEAALRQPLPGLAAQARMAPNPRPLRPPTPDHQPRIGAVLVLLYPAGQEGELHLVLTRRTDTVANHRGQISFPGGRVDPDDPSTAQAALREICEELGVCQADLRLLGALTPLYIPPSDFLIYPHVAYLPQRPDFRPHPEEVAELLEAPLAWFLDDSRVGEEEATVMGRPVRIPYFLVHGHKVWGATAMVLAELAEVVRGALSA